MNGKLFVVATPIGNLKDITLRALEILKEVDLILAEDTRRTQNLLNFYQIKKPILSFHQHSKEKKIEFILEKLKKGKKIALVSEAGTPGISDPGPKLIQKILERLGEKIQIVPIPGPSAVTTLLSVAGVPADKFLFLGFLPKKRKRKKIIREIATSNYPVLFFESPWRVLKTLKELEKEDENLNVVLGRELTKYFEKIERGKISEVIKRVGENPKGEFTVLIWKERKGKEQKS